MFRYASLLLGLLLLSLGASRACAGAGVELLDYMIQDTCIDAHDHPVAGDPATCARHRNLKIGEPSNYLVTDLDRSNHDASYQAASSFPVLGSDGQIKIVIAKNLQGNFDANFRFSYLPTRDGYDLIDTTSSPWLSIIRTSDGGCFDQIWSSNGSTASMAVRAGGWILFPYQDPPSRWPPSSHTDITTYKVQVSHVKASCHDSHSRGVTYWNAPASYTFESGKKLLAIRSDHYTNHDLGHRYNTLERFYYTREYGFSRWEAWITRAACNRDFGESNPICHPDAADYPLKGRCSVLNTSATGIAGLDRWGGQDWIRTDCRDQTHYIALKTPQLMLDASIGQGSGYTDLELHGSGGARPPTLAPSR